MINIRQKNRKKIIVVIAAILIIFFLNFIQGQVKSFFYWFSSPIQKVLWGAGERSSDFLESFLRTKGLKTEKEELLKKNKEFLAEIANLQELRAENNELRKALGIELQKDFKLSFCLIIGKDISQDYILIDKGQDDGVSENMPIITAEKVLVGKISETYKNFSKAMLISNKKSFFDAKIQSDSQDISGMIRGRGNFNILFDFLPREMEIKENDIVITSAIGGIFPAGLLVGKIKNIKKNDIESFQTAEIEQFFNLSESESENLFIVKDF